MPALGRGALRRAFLALQFLTRLPTPQYQDFERDDLSRSAFWFPAVGIVIGLLVAAAVWLGALVDPWFGAFLGVLAWTWITGALHLDGLGDLVDGLGAAHRNPERLHAVMADPNTGTFAVVAIVLQLMAKLVALHALASPVYPWSIALLTAAARLAPLYWSSSLPPLGGGSGQRFAWHVEKRAIWSWAVLLILIAMARPTLLLCAPAMLAWRWFLSSRLGGQTGDALGAGIEIIETVGLFALVVAA